MNFGWRCGALLELVACVASIAGACAFAQPPVAPAADPGLPHLEKRGAATQLVVDGKPFLILGGEVHNSSSSSLDYMKPVWPRLAAMHLNTVVLPVAWETIEPTESRFDFTVVDGLLEGARANHLRLVLLWFGAWKNTYSSYAPGWVKRDPKRFPRVQTSDGRPTERLSPFSSAVRDADAHAFAALMRHLRDADSARHTVLMVQVENEVGVIPESRDHSAIADAAFAASVPDTLMRYLAAHRHTLAPKLRDAWEAAGAKTAGTWQQVFGNAPLTDDLFMAWHYAAYIQQVAAAGKREYPLPMYANAALIRPNYQPGQYNSGGPLPHSMDLWRAAAPALDFLSPDIYFNEFATWAADYARAGNPLFIPEAQGGAAGAANALYAFGRLHAIGFSPFGIDDATSKPIDLVGITQSQRPDDPGTLPGVYAILSDLAPLLLEKQASGATTAEMIEGEAQRSARVALGPYTATLVSTSRTPNARVSALFLNTAPDEFWVVAAGDGLVTFSAEGAGTAGIESIDEEFFEDGRWVARRRLNGDESSQGQVLKLAAADAREGRIYRVRLFRSSPGT